MSTMHREVYKNTTNFQGDTFEASLNMERLGLVIEGLAKNYLNPEMAVIREWVSNGFDSHVDAGQTNPVLVTLPTDLEPTLVVQDFGVGLSYEEFKNIYVIFGSTTKDEESKDDPNTVIGGKGIGAKSALALASQYTVVTIKDGLKNVFLLERSATGGMGIKTLVHNQKTDEANGLTASVAVDRPHVFQDEATVSKVLQGWPKSSVVLKNSNRDFESIYEIAEELPNGFLLEAAFEVPTRHVTNYGYENFQIKSDVFEHNNNQNFRTFVGPVSYDFVFDSEDFRSRFSSHNGLPRINQILAIKVGIGSVSFPQSREVIETTRSNRRHLTEALFAAIEDAKSLLVERVENAATYKEAFALLNSVLALELKRMDMFDPKAYVYKGGAIPTHHEVSDADALYAFRVTGNGYNSPYKFQLTSKTNENVNLLDIAYVIEKESGTSNQTLRNLFRKYAIAKELKAQNMNGYLIVTETPNEWIKAASREVISESALRAIAATAKVEPAEKKDPLKDRIRAYKVGVASIEDSLYSTRTMRLDALMARDDYDEAKTVVFMNSESPISNREFKEIAEISPEFFEKYYILDFSTRAKKETISKVLTNPMITKEAFFDEVVKSNSKVNPYKDRIEKVASTPFIFSSRELKDIEAAIAAGVGYSEDFKKLVENYKPLVDFATERVYNSPMVRDRILETFDLKYDAMKPKIHKAFEILNIINLYGYKVFSDSAAVAHINFATENYMKAITKERELAEIIPLFEIEEIDDSKVA